VPVADNRNYRWLPVFYLIMGFAWAAIGIADLIARPRWFGWAGIVFGIAFWGVAALWYRKTRRS